MIDARRLSYMLLLATSVLASSALAQDAFATIRCGADIPRALIGKRSPRGPVSVTERKHLDLGLRDEGATQISDTLTYIGWTICGHEYAFIEDAHDRIRDVIPFPTHSRRTPGFFGTCKRAGRAQADAVLAVLENERPFADDLHYSANDSSTLPAIAAWKVDEKRARFVAIQARQLACPRNSIFTVDGGP